ncbi:hypothetical protein KXD40_000123 [Peronospora effusa]|uniref:WRKY19-like zinc finger domain-containing protein n=1 Tax=Peronospora effusa TaxID=542832 RepID=A0A425CCS2_9STRA|nr:hypothetical protein DD237_006190 [Peronospora effusa]UIZ20619.1 hypothetical protein KXD40_000123 [Peronospora effusa]
MDWMQPRDQLLHSSSLSTAPSFRLVDANNRVRELTDPLKRQLRASHSFCQPQASNDGRSAAELEEERQLEQQLQVQKEEMCFISPLPRHDVGKLRVTTKSHAFTYGGSRSSSNLHSTPPLAPPVSPFASMALSAPAAPIGKIHNPFLSAKMEKNPRLPSLDAMRNSPSTHLKPLGIASRPSSLSLHRFSDVSTLSSSSQSASPSPSPSPLHQPQLTHHSNGSLRSLSNTSLSSVASTSPTPYSQSLPGVFFLQDRRRSRMSFDDSNCMSISSEDEESGMRLLSSSVGRSEGSSDAMTAAANAAAQAALYNSNVRGGRVCRYANCGNIARSRGLCRTHGGGKRCSHSNCNKSAQANRKCIAHGGGTPCSYEDCEKTAQSRGLCKAHGGGARCKHPDCPKSSQSKGLCRGHGGGIKCKAEGCEKWWEREVLGKEAKELYDRTVKMLQSMVIRVHLRLCSLWCKESQTVKKWLHPTRSYRSRDAYKM